MTNYAAANPFELWDMHKSIGMMRNVIPAFSYWLPMFTAQVESTDEYIDFEKLPVLNRRLAPFVKPAGTGKPIYTDSSTGFRFKPAYIKLKDAIDPTKVVRKIPGIDAMLTPNAISPMQRREMLRAAMTLQHVNAIERRWEWMAARAVIDGMITIGGTDEYPAVTLDFRRDAGQTVTLASGSRWGDSGVSIISFIQRVCDTMIYPTGGFGGFPTRLTVGSSAWAAMRQDPEIKDLMNKFFPVAAEVKTRGLIASEKVVFVGTLPIGGGNGVSLEVYLYRDSYVSDAGTETQIMAPTDAVFTSSTDAINGFRCYGAIIDPYAEYQALPIFPRNWMESGDPAVENLLHQSAPLMVPVNPNATFKATVTAS